MIQEKVNISPILKLLRVVKYHALLLHDNFISIDTSHKTFEIPFTDIETMKIEHDLVWGRFELVLKGGTRYFSSGWNKTKLKEFFSSFEKSFAKFYYADQFKKAQKILQMLPSEDQYFQMREFNTLAAEAKKDNGRFYFLVRTRRSKIYQGSFNSF